jgi:hypothetical protein
MREVDQEEAHEYATERASEVAHYAYEQVYEETFTQVLADGEARLRADFASYLEAIDGVAITDFLHERMEPFEGEAKERALEAASEARRAAFAEEYQASFSEILEGFVS